MKFYYFSFIIVLLIISTGCKKTEAGSENLSIEDQVELDSQKTAKQNDGLILFTGDFLYFDNAAVLNTGQTVYGMVVNDKIMELDSMVQPFKNEPTDMISVGIRGKLIPKDKNAEGWDYSIEVEEIVDIYPDLNAEVRVN